MKYNSKQYFGIFSNFDQNMALHLKREIINNMGTNRIYAFYLTKYTKGYIFVENTLFDIRLSQIVLLYYLS